MAAEEAVVKGNVPVLQEPGRAAGRGTACRRR